MRPVKITIAKTIGWNIRKARMALNVSQTLLARRTGLTQGQVSRIERGKNHPHALTLQRIATYLKTTPGALKTPEPGYEPTE
jgi:transcriptional regulator with XRE-family HTH domain